MSGDIERLEWDNPVTLSDGAERNFAPFILGAIGGNECSRQQWAGVVDLASFPTNFTGEEAARVRDLLEHQTPTTGSKAYDAWSRLWAAFLPPVEACRANRETIKESADWISGIDFHLNVGDEGYEAFEATASQHLVNSKDAYNSRPAGCEMELSGDDDCFDCNRCQFSRSTDTSL